MKLILIDDDCLVVSALKMILETHPGFEVAATGDDGAKALPLYREHHPDVRPSLHVGMVHHRGGVGHVRAGQEASHNIPQYQGLA